MCLLLQQIHNKKTTLILNFPWTSFYQEHPSHVYVCRSFHAIFDPVSIKYLCRKTDESLRLAWLPLFVLLFVSKPRAPHPHRNGSSLPFRLNAHFVIANRMISKHHSYITQIYRYFLLYFCLVLAIS